jgi:pimeloyl-ACP methyl ester carboxylesterase
MTGAQPRPRVVMVDGVPMSGLVAEVADPRAVIVAIHGGATSAAYFDCPGNPRLSLLRLAATQGYTAIALDRPGYGASALYADEMTDPDRRVALTYGAVDKIVADSAFGAGVFLLAHSAGCELALRMAVADRAADVIGLELAGTGLRYHPDAQAVIREATVTSRPAGLRDLLWQPTDLYPPEVLTGALSAPGVAYEGGVTANWARQDFADLAARVSVPVQFSIADHESVWESTPEAVGAITALFTATPRIAVNEMADSGHNLSVGLTAGEYHQRVLSFISECVAATRDSAPAEGPVKSEVEA